MSTVAAWQLRARFAEHLSALYGTEVPAYTTLVDVSREVNLAVVRDRGDDAQRLGSIDRVTAERHGAIRVGTPEELRQVGRIFAALGMYPTGFYDLRETAESSVPVVSTAFRPTSMDELEKNPFRVFTSLLATTDRRFFNEDLSARLQNFLARRRLFSPRLLDLADKARADGCLPDGEAAEFLAEATNAFALSREPIDRGWYKELESVSAVAADIGGVTSTHINHLTPRVLDIDALYARMSARGIEMIDKVQGPPAWAGPDVLLRQTSFRALEEPRLFIEPDGTVNSGVLRVRFGEVEARGMALTRHGREVYDRAVARLDDAGRTDRLDAGTQDSLWAQFFPRDEVGLLREGLGAFTFDIVDRTRDGHAPAGPMAQLVTDGWLTASPIVYEDFLPRSAAGIFQSNLTDAGVKDGSVEGAALDAAWLEGVLEAPLEDPYELYQSQQDQSAAQALAALGLEPAV